MPHAPSTLPLVVSAQDVASYPVVEHFYTIQGEGSWAGKAAYFIRLAGCDVGCPWCDTKESWTVEGHPELLVADMVTAVEASGAEVVVVTGGEPAMHDMKALTKALKAAGKTIHLETSGAYPIRGAFDWITLSPKKYKPPVDSSYRQVDELKVVIFNRYDFRWAKAHAARCSAETALWVQPEWNRPQMMPEIIQFVKTYPQWRLSVQTHKYLQVP